MNKYKYRTVKYERSDSTKIDKVKIDKETNKSIWIDGEPFKKENICSIYHDSFDEAHAYLLSKNRIKIRNLEIETKRAKGNIILLNAKKETGCK